MSATLKTPVLQDLLKPVSQSLNREAAEKLVRLKVDRKTQAHIDKLARRSNEGRLTATECAEYENWVFAIDFIAILQSEARALLAQAKL
jgi:hypothetical protein